MVSLQLKAKLMDVVASTPVVILNIKDAAELGVYAGDRVLVQFNSHAITASLDTTKKIIPDGIVGIYRDAEIHGLKNNSYVHVSPTTKPKSIEYILKKMRGMELKRNEVREIIEDVQKDRLSDGELGAFLTSVYIHGYTDTEVAEVTLAMVEKATG